MNYLEPSIVDYGDLTEITAAMTDGDTTDRDFPAGTPRGEITFS